MKDISAKIFLRGILLALILFVTSLQAEEEVKIRERKDRKKFRPRIEKTEAGFWLGASSPMPGGPVQGLLNTGLGFGGFTRFLWPFQYAHTELGFSYTSFASDTERRLTIAPVYAAIAYEVPMDLPISFFVKGGGGYSYVSARPSNVFGWDPMLYAGLEASFVAGRKVRIGLRIDYNKIYESYKETPDLAKLIYLSPYQDPRLYNPNNYKKVDADFFHFGLMISLFL